MTALAPPVPSESVHTAPVRSSVAAGRIALGALILRDLVVLRKHLFEFVVRTLVQPFLLCFVFLYVFPKIGQGIGGASNPEAQSAFAKGNNGGFACLKAAHAQYREGHE